MKPLIGYWRANDEESVLARPDGASVRLLGRDATRPAHGNRLWLRFMLDCSEGRLEIPVEQRLVGRDTNFRALWYRADFRQCAPGFALWSAAERLIADALTSWPRGHLADGMPSGVGIQGGVRNGRFDTEMYRLYTPGYVKIPKLGGTIAAPAKEQFWTYAPGDEARPNPDFTNAGPHGSRAMWNTIEAAGQRWPTLASDDAAIIIRPAEHGALRLLYVDRDIQSDKYLFRPPYANQERIWHLSSKGGAILGPPKEVKTIFDVADSIFPGRRKKRGASEYATVPLDVARRVITAFHDALFQISLGDVTTNRMNSPPLLVRTGAPWQRAGLYHVDCVTATELATNELRCAFLDEPEPQMILASPTGPAFDAVHGSLTSPDGSVLNLESATPSHGAILSKLFFRCRHAGLDWPVIVRRDDQRPDLISWSWPTQLQSRWVIDHDECLSAWHGEGHAGFPDYELWDCLRQFLEDAILTWGDGPAAGPAPQSLATTSGWYNGSWRGREFKRLMSRPLHTDQATGNEHWESYLPAARWQSKGPIWQRQEACRSANQYGPPTPPPAFEKFREDSSGIRFLASGYAVRWVDRGEIEQRMDFADYLESGRQYRLRGNRERFYTTAFLTPDNGEPSANELEKLAWPRNGEFERVDLALWRRFRDAAEGGLRDGESVTLAGGYFFNACYTRTLRITALGVEPKDFDYHMFA